jgi:hypothetical protein
MGEGLDFSYLNYSSIFLNIQGIKKTFRIQESMSVITRMNIRENRLQKVKFIMLI